MKKIVSAVLIAIAFLNQPAVTAQPPMQQFLQRSSGTAGGDDVLNNHGDKGGKSLARAEIQIIGSLRVAVWRPEVTTGSAPLVIFSHGFHSGARQSSFIMQALAKAGYLVIAPYHNDALAEHATVKAEVPFERPQLWNDKVYEGRRIDIVTLLKALHQSPQWSSKIDWTKVALSGHSLGGYTVLALGGACPRWKISGIRAIVAFSPYCQPFVESGNLADIKVPVMYQGGTRDIGITPTIKRPEGSFSKTGSPAEFVEFDRLTHFGWTNLNRNQWQLELISHYAIAFLNKYVRDDLSAKPEDKLLGVTEIRVK